MTGIEHGDDIPQGETIPARRYGPFAAVDVAAYAVVSGDDNPLHRDQTLAARAGLARPPIHGMLAMGQLDAYLRAWRPWATVAKLSGKFIRPLLVGEAIEVSGKVVRGAGAMPAVVRLTIKRADAPHDIVCLAEAFIRP